MRRQAGVWDIDERYVRLGEAGDPLEKLSAVPMVVRKLLAKALRRSDGAEGGRPPMTRPEPGARPGHRTGHSAWTISTLNIITAPIGGRPPFGRSEQCNAASRAAGTTQNQSRKPGAPAGRRSSKSAAYRSSRSKKPALIDTNTLQHNRS